MKYTHILSYIARTPWAILPEAMEEILSIIAFRSAGHVFTSEEIRARIGEPPPAPDPSKRGAVAVLPLRGIIAHRMGGMDEASGGMSAERFSAMCRQVAADDSVGTVVVDSDTPGGTVPGVMEAADALWSLRQKKHVVAVANSRMASAGYWICSQAHEVVAIPSALDRCIGSIGVFMVHQDLSEHLAKEGVKTTIIKAGKHKAEMNPFTPLTEEQEAELQKMVEATYAQFVKAVARGRGVSEAAVRSGYGEGRALAAKDAKAAGLIDRIATMDETLSRLTGRAARAGGMRAEDVVDEIHAHRDDSVLQALHAADEDRRRRLERF